MRVRRILASVTLAVMMVGGGVSVAVAPGASAVPESAGCTELNGSGYDGHYTRVFIDSPFHFFAGDEIAVMADKAFTLSVPDDVQVGSGAAGQTLTYRFTSDIDTTLAWATVGVTKWLVSCTNVEETSESAPPTTPIPIPPWVQAYGIFHHDDACQTGWGNSWQMWAEPITGGWVCSRTIPSLG